VGQTGGRVDGRTFKIYEYELKSCTFHVYTIMRMPLLVGNKWIHLICEELSVLHMGSHVMRDQQLR
jgi:hypothetical protein